MNQVESFAGRLCELRAQKGLSKSALARIVGVSTTCVWNWEEGNTHPRADALARIALALSTTEAFLERGVDPYRARPPETGAVLPYPTDPAEPIGEVIRRAREQIATAAGLTLDQVKVVLEFGA